MTKKAKKNVTAQRMVPEERVRALLHGRPRRRGAEKFDPEHLLAEDSKGRSLAAPCVFNTVCVYLCVFARSHPLLQASLR